MVVVVNVVVVVIVDDDEATKINSKSSHFVHLCVVAMIDRLAVQSSNLYRVCHNQKRAKLTCRVSPNQL